METEADRKARKKARKEKGKAANGQDGESPKEEGDSTKKKRKSEA